MLRFNHCPTKYVYNYAENLTRFKNNIAEYSLDINYATR